MQAARRNETGFSRLAFYQFGADSCSYHNDCSSPSKVALRMFSSSIFLVFRFAFSEMYFHVDQIPIHRKSCRKDKAGHVIILPLCTLDTCSDSTRRSDNLKGHLPTLCSGYIYRTLQWPLVGSSFDPHRQTCQLLLQERRLACRLLGRQIVHTYCHPPELSETGCFQLPVDATGSQHSQLWNLSKPDCALSSAPLTLQLA